MVMSKSQRKAAADKAARTRKINQLTKKRKKAAKKASRKNILSEKKFAQQLRNKHYFAFRTGKAKGVPDIISYKNGKLIFYEIKPSRPSSSKNALLKRTQSDWIQKFCFKKGFSANFTSNETGFNIKTVCKYYNDWTKKIGGAGFASFIDNQRIIKQQAILVIDREVFELYDLQSVINSEISSYQKKNQHIPNHLINAKLKCCKEILNSFNLKDRLGSTPTLELDIKQDRRMYGVSRDKIDFSNSIGYPQN